MVRFERDLERQYSQQADNTASAERRLKQLHASEEKSAGELKDINSGQLENELKGSPTLSEVTASETKYRKLERSAKNSVETSSNSEINIRQEGDRQATDRPQTFAKFGELEPNTVYERNGYDYNTDRFGRIETIHGKLRLGEGIRTRHQTEVGKEGYESDEGGHLIASRFNGSPEGMNLIPQDANLNRGDWKRMENKWAEALEDSQDVEVVINADYADDSLRPAGFYVWEQIGSEQHEHYFENKPYGEVKDFEG